MPTSELFSEQPPPSHKTHPPRVDYATGLNQIPLGLTPADVLLIPRLAPTREWHEPYILDDEFDEPSFLERDLSSREKVDVTTTLDREGRIKLAIPIISSPMVDVTGVELAVELGKLGGLPIIHRAQSIEDQVKMVKEVKAAMGYVFNDVPTLFPDNTVLDARMRMNETQRGLVAITDKDNKVLGIVTTRDVKKDIAPQDDILSNVMTAYDDLVTITPDIDTTDPANITVIDRKTQQSIRAIDLMYRHRIEKLIITDDKGHLIGAITDHDLRMLRENPHATLDDKGKIMVGAAIGIKGNYMFRAKKIVEAGANLLCVDVANAYIDPVPDAVRKLRKKFPHVTIMAGSVATREGVRRLAQAGADIIRCNIGSGSICITRGVSGFGVPGLTAIMECADEADQLGVSVIADGGIEDSSDIAKYIAAGAKGVMLGRVLAATEEGAGRLIIDPETRVRYREYRGMASEEVRQLLEAAERGKGKSITIYSRRPEGIPSKVVIIGHLRDVMESIIEGLRSGMTYGGVSNLEQLRNELMFVRVSPAGQRESAAR